MTLAPDQYVRAYSGFQDGMEGRVRTEVQRVYASTVGRYGPGDPAARDALAEALSGLVLTFGPEAEAFGMFLFEEMTGTAAVSAGIAAPAASAATTSSVYGILAKYASPLTVLYGSMSRHTLKPTRLAIHNSTTRTRDLAYARVPNYRGQRDGKGPCEFCLVLASRGPVYASAAAAGDRGEDYHDDCYCVPTVMQKASGPDDWGDPTQWPRGYNPERLYQEVYAPNHRSGDSIRDVASSLRAFGPKGPQGR